MSSEIMEYDLYDQLDGQVALVTGATRGIGKAIASKLSTLGATVYAGARNVEDVDAADQRSIRLDVTEPKHVRASIERIRDEEQRLDILVNNAGIDGSPEPFHEVPLDTACSVMRTNLWGPMQLTHAALPLLIDCNGHVINISSSMATLNDGMCPGWAPYHVSKAGLNAFTVYLANEFDSETLMANAVNPGKVKTSMGGPEADRTPEEAAETPVWLARMKPGQATGTFWKRKEPASW